ncbi:MAG: transcriptional regulator NrdR [Thermodesulfobacteriota bacterium]|nr:transcriptional regulator NrdR [Thermodesulfobacteriota bacterium]
MKCPRCSGVEDKVIQSRVSSGGTSIRRRRECLHCGNRFTTYERIEEFTPVVIKKDGTRQKFVPEKIVAGVMKACEKRPVSMDDIEQVRDSIIQDIQRSGDKEVSSSYIGEKVMDLLHGLDTIAYVRFASVYREFKDVDEFMEEVMRLIQHRESS